MEGGRQLKLAVARSGIQIAQGGYPCLPSPGVTYYRLALAAVKAQDEFAALGLDGNRTQPKIA